ncbi:MAG: acyl-CoA dehydrogenase, partial [Halofilum sp. (in: g-proteobacteria)]
MIELLLWLFGIVAALTGVARLRAGLRVWTAVTAVALLALGLGGGLPVAGSAILWALFLLVFVPLNVSALRRRAISEPLRRRIGQKMPAMSETEREAIEAGTVGWESQIFRGGPDWR